MDLDAVTAVWLIVLLVSCGDHRVDVPGLGSLLRGKVLPAQHDRGLILVCRLFNYEREQCVRTGVIVDLGLLSHVLLTFLA